MDEMEILSILKEQFVKRLGIEEDLVTMDASLADSLNLESLDEVELILDLEERFGIEINDEAAGQLRTVGDVVRLVQAAKTPVNN